MADSNATLRDALMERPVLPIPIATTTTDTTLTSKPCLLCGWSLRETTGSAAATCEFDGSRDPAGPTTGEILLAAGTSSSFSLMDEGVLCESGLLLHVISGSVKGVAYARVGA